MPAPADNQNAKKLKTKEIKEKVYKDYCKHIASGKTHKSWFYNQDGLQITWKTIESYIKHDQDLDPVSKEIAEAQALAYWEEIGFKMLRGEIKGGQPAIYQMNMRNRFGWDRDPPQREDNRGIFNLWYEQQLAK